MAKDENLPEEPLDDVVDQTPNEDIEETVEPETGDSEKQVDDKPKKSFKDKLKALPAAYWAKKKWTLPLTGLVLVLLIFAIPFTRYAVLGLFMKGHVEVSVVDSKTNTPVSGASVTVGGSTLKTDGSGKASAD